MIRLLGGLVMFIAATAVAAEAVPASLRLAKESATAKSPASQAARGALPMLRLEVDGERPWRLLLSGAIATGDAERFARMIVEPFASRGPLVSEVVLASPGGNLSEALRLARLISGLHLDTHVRAGGKCSSACFFLFLAGDQRTAGEMSEGRLVAGRIGLHRPYLQGPAVQQGDVALVAQRQQAEMNAITEYLRKQSVPLRLIDEMMTHASNDIYWLSDEDVWQLGEFHPGLEEVLIARCRYDKRMTSPAYAALLQTLDAEEREKSEAQLAKLMQCMTATRAQFAAERQAFIARLKTGWRPWPPPQASPRP